MTRLAEVVSNARTLLVDFDGPICSVFAGYPAATIAVELQALVRSRLSDELRPGVALPPDPLQLLCAVADLGDSELTIAVADACRDAETAAVATATPTPGAGQLLQAAQTTGRTVVIVSNNATAAIDAYLRKHDLSHYVAGVAARYDGMDPHRLKPDPLLLHRGLKEGQVETTEAVFIGDSTTDVEAGHAASIPTIGYANKLGKDHRLAKAGAAAVTDSMFLLADEIRHTPTRRSR